MIQTDPGSRTLESDPGIRFRDPRTCLLPALFAHQFKYSKLRTVSVCRTVLLSAHYVSVSVYFDVFICASICVYLQVS